jgi:hypothetical protein
MQFRAELFYSTNTYLGNRQKRCNTDGLRPESKPAAGHIRREK